MHERSNREWVETLSGSERDEALEDLRGILLRGLRHALGSRNDVGETDFEDFVQDGLVKILDNLDSFRGESRFTTWAHKITVRVALSELRRKRWRDTSLEGLIERTAGDSAPDSDFVPQMMADSNASPEQQALQNSLMSVLQETIATKLTEKQRQALVAVRIHGMPLEEVARRMGTNRNSLYKLLHDARQRLKKALIDADLNPQELLAVFEGAA
ncbi:sigma-70 family RNA polymerase sigma factor [Chloroflexi bacterium TSY]|nr:sigma-70 family RNA polymerase sigma factor [Chloroflexi bacterium TSY]